MAAAVDAHMMRHGGARTMGLGGDILDFSTSVNPLGMPPAVPDAISDAIPDAADYPDALARALEAAAAAYAGVSAEMVVAGNGATEIIHNICRHTAGRDMLLPSPGFGEYGAAAALCGSPISHYDAYPNGVPYMMPQNGCIFVCNPSNPAGRLLERSRILETANAAAGCMLVVDECFIEMTPHRRESVVPYVKEYDNVVVLRSLTKSFGLAGLRVGYCVASPDVASILRNMRMPWSINALAQAAGVEALSHPEHLEATLDVICDEVGMLQRSMRDMPRIEPLPTDANYFVARTHDPAPAVVDRLLRRNILVRDCTSFGMNNHIRIAVKAHAMNKMLLNALSSL